MTYRTLFSLPTHHSNLVQAQFGLALLGSQNAPAGVELFQELAVFSVYSWKDARCGNSVHDDKMTVESRTDCYSAVDQDLAVSLLFWMRSRESLTETRFKIPNPF